MLWLLPDENKGLSMKDRVVVTGLGVITPFGVGTELFWNGICSGTNATGKIECFKSIGFDRDIGGVIKDFDPARYISHLDVHSIPKTTQLAIAVAKMACLDANISSLLTHHTVGISFGTTMGNQSVVEEANDACLLKKERPSHLDANFSPSFISRHVAYELGTKGPALVLPTACAAGCYAIGWGYDLIKSGRADIVIAGGSDAMSRGCYAIFNRLNAIAKDVCRPFDKNRTGMIVSEGAGCLILEKESFARKRGARIYAELLGCGMGCDAHHPTAPHPEGEGACLSFLRSLDATQKKVNDISYISAHGTGTIANDVAESKAIQHLAKERAEEIPVSSIKSMIGHTMGGASAIESVACVLSIYNRKIPPTANYVTKDPQCHGNIVPNHAREMTLQLVLNIGIGFGGNIATTAFGDVR
jgi:3-oxoacyl-(acyl-carrier-protein) synthase